MEIKEELKKMTELLEAGVQSIFEDNKYIDYLKFCAQLPKYSINNQLLIWLQMPTATMCQSYTGWKTTKRQVVKGQKGIRIFAPTMYKKQKYVDKVDSNGNPVLNANGLPEQELVTVTYRGFKPATTFDISQTTGEPVPNFVLDELGSNVDGYDRLMDAVQKVSPVSISFEDIKDGAKGYYSKATNSISIKSGMSQAQTLKTALHEVAHAILHSGLNKDAVNKSRQQKECEAESVAYVITQHFGIDTSDYSFGYVASWSKNQDIPELKASLETVRFTAADLIEQLEAVLA